jgi:hypothetical protein
MKFRAHVIYGQHNFNLLPKSQLIINNNLDNMLTYWNSFVILIITSLAFLLFIFSGLNVEAYFDFKQKNYIFSEKDFLAIFFKRQLQCPAFIVFFYLISILVFKMEVMCIYNGTTSIHVNPTNSFLN